MKARSTIFALAVLLFGVSLAGAQQRPPQPPPQPPAAPSMPPAPAALSVPDPLAGFRPQPGDLYRSPDGSDRFQLGSLYPPPVVMPPIYPGAIYPGGYYPFGYAYPGYETSMAETYRMSMAEAYLRRQREGARGGLVLQTVPSTAQIFVDGHYVGVADDFGPGRGAMNLDAGSHRIELRAAGYETLSFSVMISPNHIVRYRGDMQLASPQPAAAPAPAAPAAAARPPAVAKSLYVIPNCYAGDKPPSQTLPKGCDSKKLQTRKATAGN